MKHQLREYQLKALDELRALLRSGKKRLILQAPTGAGKTSIAAEMIRGALDKGKRVLFVADRIELINQAAARLDAEDIPFGVIQAQHWRTDFSKPAQVCSIQTLARRKVPAYDLCIIDEAHTLHQAHINLLQTNNNVPTIGLSATPWAKGLGKHFETMVVGSTTSELIDLGFLVKPRVYAPSQPDLSGVHTVRGDYDETELGEASNKPKLVGDIFEHWIKLAEFRQTIAFAVNIAHSKAIVERFKEGGVKAEHIDCYVDSDDRHATIEAFKRGDITLLSSVDILSKGFDYPGVACAIMARPTKSLMLHVQQSGRVLRPSPGKEDALILDHAGNTERLGFITDELPDRLDDGKKKAASERKEPLPKPCPSCHFMKPAKVHKCPACGFAPERQPLNVDHVDGELVEVKGSKKNKLAALGKQNVYSQLRCIQVERGFSDGWTAHKYREIHGVWPRGLADYTTEPTPELRSWVRYQQIRYAKAKEKFGAAT